MARETKRKKAEREEKQRLTWPDELVDKILVERHNGEMLHVLATRYAVNINSMVTAMRRRAKERGLPVTNAEVAARQRELDTKRIARTKEPPMFVLPKPEPPRADPGAGHYQFGTKRRAREMS